MEVLGDREILGYCHRLAETERHMSNNATWDPRSEKGRPWENSEIQVKSVE